MEEAAEEEEVVEEEVDVDTRKKKYREDRKCSKISHNKHQLLPSSILNFRGL